MFSDLLYALGLIAMQLMTSEQEKIVQLTERAGSFVVIIRIEVSRDPHGVGYILAGTKLDESCRALIE